MKKTKYLFLFSLLIALVFPANYTYADSYTEHLINLRSAGVVEAQSLASQIDNSELSVKAINNPQRIFRVWEYYQTRGLKHTAVLL